MGYEEFCDKHRACRERCSDQQLTVIEQSWILTVDEAENRLTAALAKPQAVSVDGLIDDQSAEAFSERVASRESYLFVLQNWKSFMAVENRHTNEKYQVGVAQKLVELDVCRAIDSHLYDSNAFSDNCLMAFGCKPSEPVSDVSSEMRRVAEKRCIKPSSGWVTLCVCES